MKKDSCAEFGACNFNFRLKKFKNSTHAKHSNRPIQGDSVDASDLICLGVFQSPKADFKLQETNRGLERSVEPKHF